MYLYLMRHGIAEEYAVLGDSGRALTPAGVEGVRRAIRSVATKISAIQTIVSSPYVRAKQTAALVRDVYPDAKIREENLVVPHGKPSEFLPWVRQNLAEQESILVASHEPYIGTLAGLLAYGSEKTPLAFKTASIACFSWDGASNRAELQWFAKG